MEKEFWHGRWANNRIGFHTLEVNENLKRSWHKLAASGGDQVFVPLCGKSLDILWLLEQGHEIVGVELSSVAVEALFEENGIGIRRKTIGPLSVYQAPGLTIYCGDFFNLSKTMLGRTAIVYDRGSLVALPSEMRHRYAQHLQSLLPSRCRILLITLDYEQTEMSGPPFAVHLDEIQTLYGNAYTLECLTHRDILEAESHFKKRGLTALNEVVHLLTPIGSGLQMASKANQ